MPTQTQRTQPKRPPARRRRRRRRQFPLRPVIFVLVLLVVVGVILNLTTLGQMLKLSRDNVPRWVDVQIIDVNGSGRRGERLSGVNDIVIHYVGNPGTTAQQNHDFFDQPDTTVSAHFLVGLDGEIIQCIPLDEVSSASNERNGDTISIEVCHPDATGQFNQKTYDSLVKLTAWLCDYCDIGRDHVIRHYDITGKLCPLYFVEHPDAWEQFLVDVKNE
ncbi:peptidoglycan recognition family protein [Evtepia sp.]|uniref:peptidoglycan recognition protein family protein n=1 Tax=Evtepia sp. TaxID=2773933 RepID=UPI002A7EB806|nr:peptidoglycan recognition family protein [Evtepia sp.]MDY4430400.1 peptidoglycan recognition family protein [Evtepia sp.]